MFKKKFNNRKLSNAELIERANEVRDQPRIWDFPTNTKKSNAVDSAWSHAAALQ